MADVGGPGDWYAVRCIFVSAETRPWSSMDLAPGEAAYEERITLWRAASSEAAIELAEAEAEEYADIVDCEYTGLAQSYLCADAPDQGVEVFSLIRRSQLEPDDYLDRHFDTGGEFQRQVEPEQPRKKSGADTGPEPHTRPMKRSKIRRRMEESLADGRIATLVRDEFESKMTDGFVIALAEDWVVVHALGDGVHLEEIVMLRIKDVSSVRWRDDDPYHRRAIAALDRRVASFDCRGDVTARELISAAAGRADIFGIHFEVLDQEPLCVGRLVEPRKKSFDMHYVGRDGVWAEMTELWKYRHVTRIEVGGRYLTALNRFADPYPSPAGRAE